MSASLSVAEKRWRIPEDRRDSLWKAATPGITLLGSSGQTKAISCEPGIGGIRDRSQDRPVRRCQQPAKPDCGIRATDDFHSLHKTPVRMHSVDLPHQLVHRDTVLARVKTPHGDVFDYDPISASVQPAKKAHFSLAQGTFTIKQYLDWPSVHFCSPDNSAPALKVSDLRIHHQLHTSSCGRTLGAGIRKVDRRTRHSRRPK